MINLSKFKNLDVDKLNKFNNKICKYKRCETLLIYFYFHKRCRYIIKIFSHLHNYQIISYYPSNNLLSLSIQVYKGTSIVNDIMLPDTPTSLVSFFTTESIPRNSPVVAVSMGSSVYIYKNMKLFYKFYLPPIDIQPLEANVWRQVKLFLKNLNEPNIFLYCVPDFYNIT